MDKDITQTIYIFDKSGKFIRKINKKGRGPGEYLSLNDVAVDVSNKRLIVHDDMAQKISIFTYEGEFIEKIRLDFITTSIAYLGNNRLACYCDYINNPNYSIRSKSPNLILFDLQTRIKIIFQQHNQPIRNYGSYQQSVQHLFERYGTPNYAAKRYRLQYL